VRLGLLHLRGAGFNPYEYNTGSTIVISIRNQLAILCTLLSGLQWKLKDGCWLDDTDTCNVHVVFCFQIGSNSSL